MLGYGERDSRYEELRKMNEDFFFKDLNIEEATLLQQCKWRARPRARGIVSIRGATNITSEPFYFFLSFAKLLHWANQNSCPFLYL